MSHKYHIIVCVSMTSPCSHCGASFCKFGKVGR